jgi:hypothetical protein
MRAFVSTVLTVRALTSTAKTVLLSEADLKNLLGGVRQERRTSRGQSLLSILESKFET